MARVNVVHAVGGGVAAGFLINTIGAVIWARTTVHAYEQQYGRELPVNAMPAAALWGFFIGITAVVLYAAIRNHDGFRFATATKAALGVWGPGVALSNFAFWFMGFFPSATVAYAIAAGAVQVIVATYAGAWVYEWGEAKAASRGVAINASAR